MPCPKCRKEGIEPGDAFCRHCGFALVPPAPVPERAVGIAEKTPIAVTNSDASKWLQVFGAAMFLIAAVFATIFAYSIGLPNFGGSVLPWLLGALMLVGVVLGFIGFELRRAH